MKRFTLAALAVPAMAQSVIEMASFGHKDRISPNSYSVPGWHMSGAPDWMPQVLSDRVVLTPPYPGDKRGALWTEARVPNAQWSVDLEFRASGPEHATSGFHIWYTKQGQPEIGTNSINTVGRFEGLALVIDPQGGTNGGGGLRAFLNDGSIEYMSHPHVEGLVFAHCDYNYRNLGRPSKISLQQDSSGFQVLIDDHGCFRSNQVVLPANNFFGLTASSYENPDSIEVWKFVTSDTPQTPHPDFQEQKFGGQQQQNNQQQQYEQQQQQQDQGSGGQEQYQSGDVPEQLEDVLASSIRDQQAQFADLHNRLQIQSHSIDNLFRDLQRHTQRIQGRLEELIAPLAKEQQISMLETRVANLENKLQNLDNKVQALKNDQKDWSGHFNDIHKSLNARHDALLKSFPESVGGVIAARAPNMGLFLFLLVAFQLMLAAAYVVYKRRLAQGPKKYL